MFDKVKQLMEFKKQAEKIKRDLEGCEIEVAEGNGIKIVIDGAQRFRAIEIEEGALTKDKQAFEANLLRSLNAAVKKSQNVAAERMKSVAMPGF